MRRSVRAILISLAVLAAGLLATGTAWRLRSNRNARDPTASTAKVIRRDFSSTVVATGAVKPQIGAEVRVGARMTGKVSRLLANIGDVVKKGQVVAELEKDDLAATVEQRRAELAKAEAQLSSIEALRPFEVEKAQADVDQCKATLDLNRKELSRQDSLLGQGVATQQERDRAQERLSVAEAQYAATLKELELAKRRQTEDAKQAGAEIERARAALDNARVQLSYATLTAPIDGVIGSVSTQEGETVAAGLNAPTFVTIIDLARLQVDTFVDEVDIGKVAPGQKTIFTVDSFPAREFAGKVVAIYPKAVIQENVVNYDVVVAITDEYEGLLRPEMTASVTIQLGSRAHVLAVPAKAVKREQGKTAVVVLSNGKSETRPVTVGWKDADWVEVVSGVEEGQTVLVETPEAVKP